MSKKIKDKIISLSFIFIVFGFMLANLAAPDSEVSYSERRKLVSAPNFTMEGFLNGNYFKSLERYNQDQFVMRDSFRSLKAYSRYYFFLQQENNDMYIADGHLGKILYPLSENSVYYAAQKFNAVRTNYFPDNNTYYSIIPDKNYFLAEKNGLLSIDYNNLLSIMDTNISNMEYIDLFDTLDISDYYHTDIHWTQDNIIKVADKLLNGMNNNLASSVNFTQHVLEPFYGSYYGHAVLNLKPDKLVYLTNDAIDTSNVYDHLSNEHSRVYTQDLFDSIDPYDIFLSGAKAMLTISNPSCTTGKELVVFRDSFGSSLAPLIIHGYSKIILIDLRYVSSSLLDSYFEFNKEQDVLFLYNTEVLNNSGMLRVKLN